MPRIRRQGPGSDALDALINATRGRNRVLLALSFFDTDYDDIIRRSLTQRTRPLASADGSYVRSDAEGNIYAYTAAQAAADALDQRLLAQFIENMKVAPPPPSPKSQARSRKLVQGYTRGFITTHGCVYGVTDEVLVSFIGAQAAGSGDVELETSGTVAYNYEAESAVSAFATGSALGGTSTATAFFEPHPTQGWVLEHQITPDEQYTFIDLTGAPGIPGNPSFELSVAFDHYPAADWVVQFKPSGENLFPNADLEGTFGWTVVQATVEKSTLAYHSDTHSMRIYDNSAEAYIDVPGIVSGHTYRLRFWGKTSNWNAFPIIYLVGTAANPALYASEYATGPGGMWGQQECIFVALSNADVRVTIKSASFFQDYDRFVDDFELVEV